LFECLKKVGPKAPILLSFLAVDLHPPPSLIGKLRSPFRHLLSVGFSHLAQPGDTFLPGSGFIHLFSPDEIQRFAADTGYLIYRADLAPYPHAILVPQK
jgi:hypothetical protein